MLSVWHYTPAAMTLPSLRLSRVSGGRNGKIVLQVPVEMAGSSPIIQRNQPVQQDLCKPGASMSAPPPPPREDKRPS